MFWKKRQKLIFDIESMTMKAVKRSSHELMQSIVSGLGISVLIGGIFAAGFFYFVDSPKENTYDREINQYRLQVSLLNNKADKVMAVLQQLETNDDRVYRTIFEMPAVQRDLRDAGIGGGDQYGKFNVVENADLLKQTAAKLDLISRRIVVQSQSFDQLKATVINKEKMLASIPSIMPVDRNRIKFSSGFGWRQNPFTRSGSQFHPGIDMAGKIGTPIYATGDGVVEDPFGSMSGYGICIMIDHGYGFQTLYAHLSKKLVQPGDHVKRGQIIGYLGNTGPSTGPHLHYEVIKGGQKVNPINYIYGDFTQDEFQEIIKQAEESHDILS